LPLAILAALMVEINPATAGQDADVPDIGITLPPMYTSYFTPARDISG
jgi:hypothetical protein